MDVADSTAQPSQWCGSLKDRVTCLQQCYQGHKDFKPGCRDLMLSHVAPFASLTQATEAGGAFVALLEIR